MRLWRFVAWLASDKHDNLHAFTCVVAKPVGFSDTGSDTESYAVAHRVPQPGSIAVTRSNSYSSTKPDAFSITNAHSDTRTVSYTYADSLSKSDSDAPARSKSNSDTNSNGKSAVGIVL